MTSFSYWEQNSFFSNIDVAIIGSGIVGLNAAISLKNAEPSLNIVVLERGALPAGASTKNAGFACFGSMTELLDDLADRGENAVFGLVEERWKGLLRLRKLLGEDAINYQHLGGYELFTKEEASIFQDCLTQIKPFNHLLKDIIDVENVFSQKDEKVKDFGFQGVEHLIFNSAEGQIDTGKMMKSLIAFARNLDIEIYNGIEIAQIKELGSKAQIITSAGWSINAKRVVVATNGFAAQLISHLDLKPARNQVIISEPIAGLPFRGCFHFDRGYIYFRSVDCADGSGQQRILLGGGRNLSPALETTTQFGQTEMIQDNLKYLLKEVIFPNRALKITASWSGILGIGQSKKPIIKMTSPSIAVAVRLGGMGIAIGSLVGEQAAKLIISHFE